MSFPHTPLSPAKAGIQTGCVTASDSAWAPAFAGEAVVHV